MGVTVQGRAAGARRLAGCPAGAGLDLGVISTLPALERLVPEWTALWQRAEAPLPFTHPGWMLAWWWTLGGGVERLAAVHPNPSNQTNTAHCFLATGLVRHALPQPGGPGEVQEATEADLVGVLASLRDGTATMHAVHVAALWSVAARVAADRSGRFKALSARLGRFLAGETPQHLGASLSTADAELAGLAVGG